MSNQTVLMRGGLILLFTVSAIARYADGADLRLDTQRATQGTNEPAVLRSKVDVPRKRLWVLTAGEVRVYDTVPTEKRLIRKIELPHWSVVGFRKVCRPDMALDRTGSAFISSNGQARLLRIDTDSFDLKDYAISFQQREGLDIGFGALAFAADGRLFARTTPEGWLWEIDLNNAHAVRSNLNKKLPVDECALTTQLLEDL